MLRLFFSSIYFLFLSLFLVIYQIYALTKAQSFNNADYYISLIHLINIIYGLEILLKIISIGLYFEKNAFLKNPTNIYDSIIVIHDLYYYFFDITYRRVWLFPMRCFTFIMKINIFELKKIIKSIFLSMKLIGQVFFIVFLFCYIYSLFGLYLFSGLFKKSCFDPFSGFSDPNNLICGNVACPSELICGKLINSQYSVANFDNLLFSFMLILRVLTLDNWNSLQNLCQKTFTNYIWIYFFSFIFLGNFFLINILLAVQKINFSQMNEKINDLKYFNKNGENELNLKEFRALQIGNEITSKRNTSHDQIRKFETWKNPSFPVKIVKSKTFSKDFPTKISKNKQELLFHKPSQKLNEVQSSEYSKPSTKIYEAKNEDTQSSHLKHKTKKGWVIIKRSQTFFKKIGSFIVKFVRAIISFFIAFNANNLVQNYVVEVLGKKKYHSTSVEDILPFKYILLKFYEINHLLYRKEKKLMENEKKQLLLLRAKKTRLKFNIEDYIVLKKNVSISKSRIKTTNTILEKKIKKSARTLKIPVLLNSFRSRLIKRTFTTQKNVVTQKSLTVKQVSLSKFSRPPAQGKGKLKNFNAKSPTNLQTQQNVKSIVLSNAKKKIETNLYVDAASLSYEKICEIIRLEIENDQHNEYNFRKTYYKILVIKK